MNDFSSCYIACIAEGGAETAIMDILLDHHLLVFERYQLVEEEILATRDGTSFAKQYLRREYDQSIVVLRILDSHHENFKLPTVYHGKIKEVINVVTSPEIEMLIIANEEKLPEFSRLNGIKPSIYCKSVLKMKNPKTREFIYDYFCNPKDLVDSICKYHQVHKPQKGELSLYDLLKPEYQ